jgi:hypothetical protein
MRPFILSFVSLTLLAHTNLVMAGRYAELAAQVQADGGLLRVWATGALQTQSTSTLDSLAIGICHKVALEGVRVTQLQFVVPSGRILYTVSASQLVRC